MGKTWSKRKGSKKPKTPKLACLAVLLALAWLSPVMAQDMPKAGDIALGVSIGLNNTLPSQDCTVVQGASSCGEAIPVEQCQDEHPAEMGVGVSFEAWAEPAWSYQAGIAFGAGWTPSAYSAAAWHVPFTKSDFFTSIGLAAASGTGLLSDAGAGFQFYQGEANVQLRGDYYYDLDGSMPDRNSWGLSIAIRKKW